MSLECVETLIEMIDSIESGNHTFPIFFSDNKCKGTRFPTIGNEITLGQNGSPIDQTLFCSDSTVKNCPLPAVGSIFIPPGVSVDFLARDHSFTINRGMINIDAKQANSSAIFNVNRSLNSKNRWALYDRDGVPVDSKNTSTCPITLEKDGFRTVENKDIKFDGSIQFDVDGLMAINFNTCGSPFWPSFLGRYAQQLDGSRYRTCVQNFKFRENPFTQVHLSSGCVAFDPVGPGMGRDTIGTGFSSEKATSTFSSLYNPNYRAQEPLVKSPSYHECACAFNKTISNETDFSIDFFSGRRHATAQACGYHVNVIGGGFSPADSEKYLHYRCGIKSNGDRGSAEQISGSTESMTIKYDEGTWAKQQAYYCINGLNVAGQNINTYDRTQPSPICDVVMESYCSDNSNLANPEGKLACSCILEKRRIQNQFAGIDLPVQCFTGVCNTDNPKVYVPSINKTQGCNARLCQQVIKIHGSSISANGNQSLLCDGTINRIPSNQPVFTPVPISFVTPTQQSSGFEAGPVFFISIGIFVIMLILVVVWVIRRFVINKKKREKKSEQVVNRVTNLIR